ncbi:MAG: hypothetical protein ACR2OH_00205 [Microthrixaceae bacterium]
MLGPVLTVAAGQYTDVWPALATIAACVIAGAVVVSGRRLAALEAKLLAQRAERERRTDLTERAIARASEFQVRDDLQTDPAHHKLVLSNVGSHTFTRAEGLGHKNWQDEPPLEVLFGGVTLPPGMDTHVRWAFDWTVRYYDEDGNQFENNGTGPRLISQIHEPGGRPADDIMHDPG